MTTEETMSQFILLVTLVAIFRESDCYLGQFLGETPLGGVSPFAMRAVSVCLSERNMHCAKTGQDVCDVYKYRIGLCGQNFDWYTFRHPVPSLIPKRGIEIRT